VTIQWTAIGSIGSALAVVVAVVALVRESRASRFVVGIEMIMRLNDQFESDAFRKTRRAAALYLRNRAAGDPASLAAVHDLLNFFSMVALLNRRKALDMRAIWFTFGYHLLPYYRQSHTEIDARQKREPLSNRTLARLYDSIFRIEERERGLQLGMPAQKESDEAFLSEESRLT